GGMRAIVSAKKRGERGGRKRSGATSPPPRSCRGRVFDTTWGRDREGGNHDDGSGITPPLTPPPKGEGNRAASPAREGTGHECPALHPAAGDGGDHGAAGAGASGGN